VAAAHRVAIDQAQSVNADSQRVDVECG
jgi:hypothetical protein